MEALGESEHDLHDRGEARGVAVSQAEADRRARRCPMAARMHRMVSPTRAAGAVRVALRAESLECVATPVLHHTTPK